MKKKTQPKTKPKAPEPRDVQITRENYALAAMQGLIARGEPIKSLWPDQQDQPIKTQIARAAWEMADSMLAEESWTPPTKNE